MMKRINQILIIFIGMALFACESPVIEKIESKHPNNEPKKISYLKKVDGKEVLIEEKEFFDDGQFKMGGQFVDGKRTGEWKAYFNNGKLQSEGEFKEGKRFGKAKVYYPNGQLRYEGEYKDDKEIGNWKFYNEQGAVIKEKNFN